MSETAPSAGNNSARPVTRFQPLITANEAYPAFEREFLATEEEVHGAFRIFDLRTRLQSPEAREIGETWFDLIVHTLDRGVTIHLTVSDFDPIGAAPLHRESWRTCRQVAMAREVSRNGANMHFGISRHSARVGFLPRLVLGPLALGRLGRIVRKLNGMAPDALEQFLSEAPDIRRMTLRGKSGLRSRFFLPELWTTSHHQKIAVFDRRRLYVGGLDLNDRRFDTEAHDRPAEETWHDVQALVEGPVVAAAQAHIESFREVTENGGTPPPRHPGFIRTLSSNAAVLTAMSPRRVVREIDDWHRDSISGAETLIYLETQFFRDLSLAKALARQARAQPGLGLILVLPAAPEDVAFEGNKDRAVRFGEWLQARALLTIRRAFGPERLLVVSPALPRWAEEDTGRAVLHGAPIIYVHAKVSIFDSNRASVTSANLNGRSLRWDTEAGVTLNDPDHVALLRRRCMEHWLPADADPAMLDPATALPLWRKMVEGNARRRPEERAGFLVPHDPTPAQEFGEDLTGVPPEAV